MKKTYATYKKTGYCQKAQNYLSNEIKELFGYEYKQYRPNYVCDNYIKDQLKIYKSTINEIFNEFNGDYDNEPYSKRRKMY